MLHIMYILSIEALDISLFISGLDGLFIYYYYYKLL